MAEEGKPVPHIEMSLSVPPQLIFYFEQLSKGEGGIQQFIGKSVSEIASTLVAGGVEKMIADGTIDEIPPDKIREIEERAREQESDRRISRRLSRKENGKLAR
jgi:hypothetical protein